MDATARTQLLDLLKINQELSNLAQNNQGNAQAQSRLSYIGGALPPSAVDLMGMVTETPQYAYAYRRNNGGRPGTALSSIYLPNDLKLCHDYALCHLCEIGKSLPDEERDGLRRQLDLMGVENANLLMAGISQAEIRNDPLAFLEIAPDNEAALAIATLMMVSSETELPQAICLKSYKTFRESYPAVSLFCRCQTGPN